MTARRVLLTGRNAVPAAVALAEVIVRRRLRTRIEAAVSRLIDALDALDPDPEAEPWLGAPEPQPAAWTWTYGVQLVAGLDQQQWAEGANDDRENACEDEGAERQEAEESLGWPAGMHQVELGGNTPDADHTAIETHGRGFLRCAPDDHEPDDRDLPKDQAEADLWFPA